MPYQLDMPHAIARMGVTVELAPHWQTRGSSSFNPGGVTCHWTAGPRNAKGRPSLNVVTNGRPGIPGPLCNVYLDRNGVAVIVAAGRANHAGKGGYRGLIGNSSVFGIEAESGGDGDWTDAQRWAYPRVVAGLLSMIGRGPEMAHGHNEWAPSRKIDIRDWTMTDMRAQVAAIMNNPNSTKTVKPSEDDMFEQSDRNALAALYDLLTPGQEGVKFNGKVYQDILDTKAAAQTAATNTGPIKRDGKQVSLRQEVADTKTLAIKQEGQIAGFREALAQLAGGKEIDLDAVYDAAKRGSEAGVSEAIESIEKTETTTVKIK